MSKTYNIIMNKLPSTKLTPRLIALDLDDTLLTRDLKIGKRTVKAIQKLAAQNVYIVICTGRERKGIAPFVERLNVVNSKAGKYAILSNGSTVIDLHTEKIIYSKKLEYEILHRAKEEAAALGLPCQVYDSKNIFASCDNEFSRKDVELTKMEIIIPSDFDAFLKQGFSKMLIPGKEETVKKLKAILDNTLGEKAVVVISKPFFLEVLPRNSGKGEALEFLSAHLGIGMQDVMAFGDSMNDETMILKSGMSVAMCNGLQVIQEEAAFVTRRSNEEDGIADFLEEFVL